MNQSPFEVLGKWEQKDPKRIRALVAEVDGKLPATHGSNRIRWAVSAVEARVPLGARVLDVGCGPGQLVYALSRAGYDASGIEPHDKALEYANALGFQVTKGSVYDLEGVWDAIVFTEVLEHLQWPERALGVLERSTSLLVLTTPAAPEQDALATKKGMTLRSKYHLREWSPRCLVDFIEGCSAFRCVESAVVDGEIRAVYQRGQ